MDLLRPAKRLFNMFPDACKLGVPIVAVGEFKNRLGIFPVGLLENSQWSGRR